MLFFDVDAERLLALGLVEVCAVFVVDNFVTGHFANGFPVWPLMRGFFFTERWNA